MGLTVALRDFEIAPQWERNSSTSQFSNPGCPDPWREIRVLAYQRHTSRQ